MNQLQRSWEMQLIEEPATKKLGDAHTLAHTFGGKPRVARYLRTFAPSLKALSTLTHRHSEGNPTSRYEISELSQKA